MSTTTKATHTPDGIPLTPDVPDRLTTPPGVPEDTTVWNDFADDLDRGDADYALFSGGDDSLVSTHRAMESGESDAVLYLQTNSGLAENLEYVFDVCRRHEWPLRVERSPMSLIEMGMKYGFPGSALHTAAYSYFKQRQLRTVANEQDRKPEFVSGVRVAESDRRAKNIPDDTVRALDAEGRWYWVNIIKDKTDVDVAQYRENHGLSRNPVAAQIHRSGDCYCGAFAHRDELLIDLYAKGYDRHATWLEAVEVRVQEYRGRVDYLESEYPDVAGETSDIRDEYNPKPMVLPVARKHFPDVAAEADGIPFDRFVSWKSDHQ